MSCTNAYPCLSPLARLLRISTAGSANRPSPSNSTVAPIARVALYRVTYYRLTGATRQAVDDAPGPAETKALGPGSTGLCDDVGDGRGEAPGVLQTHGVSGGRDDAQSDARLGEEPVVVG